MITVSSPRAATPLMVLAITLLLAACGGADDSVPAANLDAMLERDCAATGDERLVAMSDEGIGRTSELGLPAGRYALPADPAPTQMVVMFHGHNNDSCSWREHLRSVAARGAVAVAMDYPTRRVEGVAVYGWFVEEGAMDSIAAVRHFQARFPSIETVHAFGVSMGGHASGMAVANGEGLFDFWIDIEGVNNFTEAYLTYRAVAPGVPAAALAVQEMEEEAGGPIEQRPERYAELTNVFRAPDMAYLRGAVMVHGVDDGLVTTDQTPQMADALNAVGVPTHLYTVFLRGDGESGDTGTGIVLGPIGGAAGRPYESPFAGHGWEGSSTHLVIRTGLDELFRIMDAVAAGDADPVAAGATPVPGA